MPQKDEIFQLQDTKILVTGGCGFIRSKITKQLSELGAKITIDNLMKNPSILFNIYDNSKKFALQIQGWDKMSVWTLQTFEKILESS